MSLAVIQAGTVDLRRHRQGATPQAECDARAGRQPAAASPSTGDDRTATANLPRRRQLRPRGRHRPRRQGQPVTDLTQADFEVLEDGKPQTIEQFRLIRVDGNPRPGDPPPRELRNRIDEEIEISRDDVRLFVFFFDDYHVRLGNSLAVKEPLTRFVQTQLRPNDVVGIMYPLTPLDGISFTRNTASVVSAIERFEGRKFDYRPRNLFEEQYARAPSEAVEQIRNQVVMTALRGLWPRGSAGCARGARRSSTSAKG